MTERIGHAAWLGRVDYLKAYELQKQLLAARLNALIPDTLLLLEHPPVVTLGRGYKPEHLLLTPEEYEAKGIAVIETDRGGDVTYHGPGQLVGYPIFDLRQHRKDVHRYLRNLEEAIIIALAHFGIKARRFPPHTGVWVGDEKVCAIGVRCSRWITMHGFALNVENNEFGFDSIVPCGIHDYGVTSVSASLGRRLTLAEMRQPIIAAFEKVFEIQFCAIDKAALSAFEIQEVAR